MLKYLPLLNKATQKTMPWRSTITPSRNVRKSTRDLHDDVGAKLLSILHSRAEDEKSLLAREALSSLRETVNQSARDVLPMNELLSNTLSETKIQAERRNHHF